MPSIAGQTVKARIIVNDMIWMPIAAASKRQKHGRRRFCKSDRSVGSSDTEECSQEESC